MRGEKGEVKQIMLHEIFRQRFWPSLVDRLFTNPMSGVLKFKSRGSPRHRASVTNLEAVPTGVVVGALSQRPWEQLPSKGTCAESDALPWEETPFPTTKRYHRGGARNSSERGTLPFKNTHDR